jgi:hypothetical protein
MNTLQMIPKFGEPLVMNSMALIVKLQKSLRLTLIEALRLTSNFNVFECKTCQFNTPEQAQKTSKIPIAIGDNCVCVPLDKLAEVSYEIQKAISGEYL